VVHKYKEKKGKEQVMEMIGLYIAYSCWFGVPIVTYFQSSQAYEYLCSNTGFFVMTVLFVRKTVHQQRYEYNKLQELNQTLTEKVKERTRQLELSNEQKTNFFVNLAHETKTPLMLISNYFDEYIAKLDSPDNLDADLKVVKSNIDKLTNDIVNFFDLERFQKGLEVYDHQHISDISRILKENIVLFKAYSKKKNITFTESIADHLLIKAHPQSLERVINNLLENAIKFSPQGGKIGVQLQETDSKIVLTIKDKGIGIAPHLHNKLFEPYYQINSEKNNYQGMGLGLSIVKKIVDNLKGHIFIHSNPQLEPGTEIKVSLEKYEGNILEEPEAILENKPDYQHEDFPLDELLFDKSKQTLLLVEDKPELLNYLTKKLKEKYNIYASRNGNEALKKLKEGAVPDLIISDIMMDGIDGFEFAKILSQSTEFNHIPLLFITAKSTQRDKLDGLSMGALDVIQKPFSMAELEFKIDSVLSSHNRQKQALLNYMASQSISMLVKTGKQVYMDEPAGSLQKFEVNCKIYNLTSQEVEVIKLMAEGLTYKNIGEKLHISEHTVKTHAQHMFKKVEVQNKLALIQKLEFSR
jgi:signal transduction histidine kinase/DNA-binding NarL/FixJ family response regulator